MAKRALLREEDVLRMLREAVKRAGNQSAWARATGANRTSLNFILSGKKPPAKRVLKALKLRKVAAYEREQ